MPQGRGANSLKDPELYEELRDQGNSKEKAARISNAAAKRGRSAVGRKGGESGDYEDWTVADLRARAKELGLTGSHIGCEHGVCGACTIRVDGRIVRGCLMLAVQADGCSVDTIEGLTDSGELKDLQKAFYERNALQCGFCTPGMVMSSAALLAENPKPTEAEVRHYLDGNICRCTGYHNIVKAVLQAAGAGATTGGEQA